MKNFLNEWPLVRRLTSGSRKVIFLDYDGTLAGIVRNPDHARPTLRMIQVLKSLAARPDICLVFISGRPLKDLRRRIGLRGCIYAGSHGWEIHGPGWSFRQRLPARMAKVLQTLPDELQEQLSCYPDAWIEKKDHSLTVHYRNVSAGHARHVKADVRNICRRYIEKGVIRMRFGKKIIDILPDHAWNKGQACLWILGKMRMTKQPVFYIGDDTTDEDAFSLLKGRAVTIRVGRKASSAADYYLPGVNAVRGFLEDLNILDKDLKTL